MTRSDIPTIDQAVQRETWQYRAVEATGGNQSKLGAIVLAILGKFPPSGRNMFGRTCTITSDGYVMADFTDRDGELHLGAFVGDVADLIRNFRGLADHLKLKDAERQEMFAELRKWIAKDWRSNPEYDLN